MITPQDAIKALIANGWTQATIAKKADSTQATISNISRGSEAKYALGHRLVALAHKHGKLRAKVKS
jgi:transcriptional regulator